jgi:hypothetical protein
MNPVRARMVSRATEWPWSSHRQYSARKASPLADTELFFNALGAQNLAATQEFERWSHDTDGNFKPWGEVKAAPPLLRDETGEIQSIDDLAATMFPADLPALKSGTRRREISRKKLILAGKAIQSGHSLVSIAEWMSCTPQAIHNLLHRNK